MVWAGVTILALAGSDDQVTMALMEALFFFGALGLVWRWVGTTASPSLMIPFRARTLTMMPIDVLIALAATVGVAFVGQGVGGDDVARQGGASR